MRRLAAASLLLLVQLALVLSVAGKYFYERRVRPRVWVRTTQVDPNQPLRGRYLALRLAVDACALPHDSAHFTQGYQITPGNFTSGVYQWHVSLGVRDGHLVPLLQDRNRIPDAVQEVTQIANLHCDQASLSSDSEFFIPDSAKAPLPLKSGEELWVEVTVPPSGPPRPVQLASSGSSGFHPLHFQQWHCTTPFLPIDWVSVVDGRLTRYAVTVWSIRRITQSSRIDSRRSPRSRNLQSSRCSSVGRATDS